MELGAFAVGDIGARQACLLRRIEPFFTAEIINDVLVPLIMQTSRLSLRVLDWLVTNYSKKYNIVCTGRDGIFNIHQGYKLALSHFRRRNFDPFRRRERITVQTSSGSYDTTIAQCNFVQWALVNGVFAYALQNVDDIEHDMNSAAAVHKAERRANSALGIPHRRRELSRAPGTKCSVYVVPTTVVLNESAHTM